MEVPCRELEPTDGTLGLPRPPQADIVSHTPERKVIAKKLHHWIHWRDGLIPILNNLLTTVYNTTLGSCEIHLHVEVGVRSEF